MLAVTATDDDASCPNNEVHYELIGMYMWAIIEYCFILAKVTEKFAWLSWCTHNVCYEQKC